MEFNQTLFFTLPVLSVLLWFAFVWYLMPRFGGWPALAEKYSTDLDPKYDPMEKLRIYWCNVGGLSYKNAVRFYETNNGLLLKLIWLFRGQQPNLLIPWKEIKQVHDQKKFFTKYVRLEIGNPQVSYIEIAQKDYLKIKDKIERYLK